MFPHMANESLDDLRSDFRKALAREASATKLIPGVKTILAFFRQRGYKIGIVSNASTLHKQPLIDFDLERFLDVSIFSCDIGHAKPEPAIYLIACQRLNVAPEKVVFVGDSYNMDVKKPLELGMQAIHISKAPRHRHRMRQITEMGLWSLEPELCSFQDVMNTALELCERRISLDSFTLFPHHPDRHWITYLCSGTCDGQAQEFWLQRAIDGTLSGTAMKTDPESIHLSVSGEVFRLTPCS
jgi:HAD superfamily hydrolase (TIGR01549 family)